MDSRRDGRAERAPGAGRRRATSMRTRALLSGGLLLGFGALATSAYWTDQTNLPLETVQSGELHVDLADNVQIKPETYAWTTMTFEDLIPGSSVARVLPVSNNSEPDDLALTYLVQGSATGTMGPHLQVTIRHDGALSGDQTTCTGGTLVGSENTPLSNDTAPLVDTDQGPLAAGASHQLCIQIRLSPDAPSDLQGASSTATFVFPATSVAP